MTAILENETITRGTLSIPDQTGATVVSWDPCNPAEVDAAIAAFEIALKSGMTAHRAHPGGQAADGTMGEVIRQFDPDAAEITMRPQIVGG